MILNTVFYNIVHMQPLSSREVRSLPREVTAGWARVDDDELWARWTHSATDASGHGNVMGFHHSLPSGKSHSY